MVNGGLTIGTPVLLETNGDLLSMWQSNDSGKAEVLTAKLVTGTTPSKSLTVSGDAELPAAAVTKVGVFVAYIAKSDKHQGVWVVMFDTL